MTQEQVEVIVLVINDAKANQKSALHELRRFGRIVPFEGEGLYASLYDDTIFVVRTSTMERVSYITQGYNAIDNETNPEHWIVVGDYTIAYKEEQNNV